MKSAFIGWVKICIHQSVCYSVDAFLTCMMPEDSSATATESSWNQGRT